MPKTPPKPTPTPDYAAIPGFADTLRKLAQVPKSEVDASMAAKKAGKKPDRPGRK